MIARLMDTTAVWRRRAGAEQYPGMPNLAPTETVPVRDVGTKLVEIGGNTVQRRVYWLLPQHTPSPGDTIDDHRVREVADAKDLAGVRLYWVAYSES